jgi:hypothetical protein
VSWIEAEGKPLTETDQPFTQVHLEFDESLTSDKEGTQHLGDLACRSATWPVRAAIVKMISEQGCGQSMRVAQ